MPRLPFIDDIIRKNNVGTYVHIGCGQAESATEVLKCEVRTLVLVEPDPACHEALGVLSKSDSRVSVVRNAVAAKPGEMLLHRLNIPWASTLRDPGFLLPLFPGVKQRDKVKVSAISFQELISGLPPTSPSWTNIVVFEALGEERAIIEGLVDGNWRGIFDHLVFRCPRDAIFEASLTASELSDKLLSAGFYEVERDEDDPDFPVFHFHASTQAMEMRRRYRDALAETMELRFALEAAKESIARQASESEVSLKARVADYEMIGAVHNQTLEHVAVLSKRVQELESDLARSSGQLSEFEMVSESLQAATGRAEVLETERDAAKARVAALSIWQGECDAELAALARELAARRDDLARLEAQHRDGESELAALREALETAGAERDAALGSAKASTSRVAALEVEAEAAAARQSHSDTEVGALRSGAAEGAAQLLAEREARAAAEAARDALRQERDSAKTEFDAASKRLALIDGEGKAAATRGAGGDKLKAVERRVQDQDVRLCLAHEELHRAEGKIAMLSELFLQDAKP